MYVDEATKASKGCKASSVVASAVVASVVEASAVVASVVEASAVVASVVEASTASKSYHRSLCMAAKPEPVLLGQPEHVLAGQPAPVLLSICLSTHFSLHLLLCKLLVSCFLYTFCR